MSQKQIPSVTAGTSAALVEKAMSTDDPCCRNCGQRKSLHKPAVGENKVELCCFDDSQITTTLFDPLRSEAQNVCRHCGELESFHSPIEGILSCRKCVESVTGHFEPLRPEDDGFPPNDHPERRHTVKSQSQLHDEMEAQTREVWSRRHDEHIRDGQPVPNCPFCATMAELEVAAKEDIYRAVPAHPAEPSPTLDPKTIKTNPGVSVVNAQQLSRIHQAMEARIKELEDQVARLRLHRAEANDRYVDTRKEKEHIQLLFDANMKELEETKTDVADLESELITLRGKYQVQVDMTKSVCDKNEEQALLITTLQESNNKAGERISELKITNKRLRDNLSEMTELNNSLNKEAKETDGCLSAALGFLCVVGIVLLIAAVKYLFA